ncbi:MAG: hypothetical protein KatS3mg131_3957 [Candidatus Tectimicrobiota bacterium]|nr:MAG: hypothetical protein KatS3mg131_3957 [Candidatus Tectomicrobia bacterium]
MRRYVLRALLVVVALALFAAPALAYHCPRLVSECNALVAKLEKNAQADQAMVAQAKQGCAEAQQLHDTGSHADAVIAAGEAIALAGKAVK